MSERDLERLLTEALSYQAEHAVSGTRPIPPMRDPRRGPRSTSTRRLWAPLASAAAVIAVAATVVALQTRGGHQRSTPTDNALTSFAAAPGAKSVAMTFTLRNASIVGVGMPIIASFTAAITDARALQAATHVTANGAALDAAWYIMRPNLPNKAPLIGVLRPEHYWPAHATIRVTVNVAGLSAGPGLAFQSRAALMFSTGPADVATVDAHAHTLTLIRDGTKFGTYPVSVGLASSPTHRGIKIVTDKQSTACLHDIGSTSYECGIRFVQRLTENGEFLLAAPWNVANIGVVNTTSGGTELLPADAQTLFDTLQVGDVIDYPNADGPITEASNDGYWNVSWSTWSTGGLVRTR